MKYQVFFNNLILPWFLFPGLFVRAFVSVGNISSKRSSLKQSSRRELEMGQGFFDDWKGFFGIDDSNSNPNNQGDNDDDEYAAGEINILTIPVQEIKPGGLRLFLMFYLMGLQNTPTKGTWRADQPTSEEYVVDFWYHDNSAVLSVTISDERKKITIDRVGSNPSTGYMMQESVVISSILDEFETMSNDPNVAKQNRLLIPETKQTIEKVRETLAFG